MSQYYNSNAVEPENGDQILILLAENFHDVEFFVPYYRFIEAGYPVTVAGLKKGECNGKYSMPFSVETVVDDILPENFDLLFIPGGKAPELLRKSEPVLKIVQEFEKNSKPIVSICHGPLVLADAGILNGKNLTGWPDTTYVLVKAGGNYIDQAVLRDKNLITSRWPGDLPQFMKEVLGILKGL